MGLIDKKRFRSAFKIAVCPTEGRRTLAAISVKNHHNGVLSPKAHFQREVTIEQVINAPMIAWPLGLFDCCPRTDGAAAAIITKTELAKKFRQDYVVIKGFGVAAGPALGQTRQGYDYVHVEETVRAAQQAYKEAGIREPFMELSLALVHDCFSIHELVIYEDLGFCPRGKAREFVDAGTFTLEGELPVNTDGGLKSFGHPQGASGLRMIYEVYKQLQGNADRRQLKDVNLGLTHNFGGFPGTGGVATICILGH